MSAVASRTADGVLLRSLLVKAVMPFFITNTAQPEPCDETWSTALKDQVIKRGLVQGRKISPKKWVDEFRLLRAEVGDNTRIDKVMEWYLNHIGDQFVPEAFSGKAFRAKFLQIERAMKKDEKRNPNIPIEDSSKELIKWVGRLHWRNGSEKQLPIVVQLSLNNWQQFSTTVTKLYRVLEQKHHTHQKRLPAAIATVKGSARNRAIAELRAQTGYSIEQAAVYQFIKAVVIPNLGSKQHFIENWMKKVWHDVKKWKKWSGDLTQFTFAPDHKLFSSMGYDWATKYGNNASLWNRFMEELNNASRTA